MGRTFLVEDDFHGDWMDTFHSREETLALADRLRADPMHGANMPPCDSSRMCCREYNLLEYDDATKPYWTLIRREPLFANDFEKGEVTSIQNPLGEFEE